VIKSPTIEVIADISGTSRNFIVAKYMSFFILAKYKYRINYIYLGEMWHIKGDGNQRIGINMKEIL